MVNTEFFSDDKKIYSVDMMFSYINIFKPESEYIDVKKLLKNLEWKCWGSRKNNIHYSPLEVIKNKKLKKYKHEIDRIEKANLNYPIIINNKLNVIDGVHRLTKAYLNNKKKIKVYKFSSRDMNKFLLNKLGNWEKVYKLGMNDFITLFYKRFVKKKKNM